jgi:hypothetical protein
MEQGFSVAAAVWVLLYCLSTHNYCENIMLVAAVTFHGTF